MSTNIRKFVGIDSYNKRPDGTEMEHEEIYSAVVNAIGLENCIHLIPATKEKVVKALKTDRYMNNIQIKEWDDQHRLVVGELVRIGINSISEADTVCVLKQAARMWAEREDLE